MSKFLCYSKVSDVLSYLKDGERCEGGGWEKSGSNKAPSCSKSSWYISFLSLIKEDKVALELRSR